LDRHRVGAAADLALDSMKRVEAGGTAVCVAHAEDGNFYAIQDTCTHENFSLSEGELWGTEVECPAHGSRFDLRTGAVRFLPAVIPARTFAVSVEDGDIYVEA
jgi:3-phenylpropionate/trans-cinnamate dioxygenase ferredoxin subunit